MIKLLATAAIGLIAFVSGVTAIDSYRDREAGLFLFAAGVTLAALIGISNMWGP